MGDLCHSDMGGSGDWPVPGECTSEARTVSWRNSVTGNNGTERYRTGNRGKNASVHEKKWEKVGINGKSCNTATQRTNVRPVTGKCTRASGIEFGGDGAEAFTWARSSMNLSLVSLGVHNPSSALGRTGSLRLTRSLALAGTSYYKVA